MREVEASININAPPSEIWRLLTDFDAFSAWNPFIIAVQGEARKGARVHIELQPPDSNQNYWLRRRIVTFEPERELRWKGHFAVPGIFRGDHTFLLESGTGIWTTFKQRESFRGLLVPFVWPSLESETREGFLRMNSALKNYAEESYRQALGGDRRPASSNP